MKQQKTILLHIADFFIHVSFDSIIEYNGCPSLYSLVRRFYAVFIVKKQKKQSIDYHINVVSLPPFGYVKNNRNYAEISLENKEDSMTISEHIGLRFFNYLIVEILHTLLIRYGGAFLHASANNVDGKAYLFLAPSGGGKSTIMHLLSPQYSALANDSIIVRKIENSYYAYQNPIAEENWWIKKGKKRYPVGHIFLLKKAKKPREEKIENQTEAVVGLTSQVMTYKKHYSKQVKFVSSVAKEPLFVSKLYANKRRVDMFLFFNNYIHYARYTPRQYH